MLKIDRELSEVNMLAARIVKIAMVASLALFAFLVTFGNVTDYDANYWFVRHVLSMDTIYPDNPLSYRAITDPALWHLAYGAIIFGEGLTCLAFTVAAAELTRSLHSDASRFRRSKRFAFIGAGLGFLVWFFGFMVIGGEWFAMWQSQTWNGQQAAFRFYMTILGVLVFVNQEDPELNPPR
jgi:predicted small integral membrane protein